MPAHAGPKQGAGAVATRVIRISARGEKELHELRVAVVSRSHQGRETIVVQAIDSGPSLQDFTDPRDVAARAFSNQLSVDQTTHRLSLTSCLRSTPRSSIVFMTNAFPIHSVRQAV